MPCSGRYVTYEGDDPQAFVIARNLSRRHLDTSQRAIVAAKLANMRPHDNQHTKAGAANLPDQISQADAAARLNVSERTVRTAKAVIDSATPAIVAAMETGRMTLNEAGKTKTRISLTRTLSGAT